MKRGGEIRLPVCRAASFLLQCFPHISRVLCVKHPSSNAQVGHSCPMSETPTSSLSAPNTVNTVHPGRHRPRRHPWRGRCRGMSSARRAALQGKGTWTPSWWEKPMMGLCRRNYSCHPKKGGKGWLPPPSHGILGIPLGKPCCYPCLGSTLVGATPKLHTGL